MLYYDHILVRKLHLTVPAWVGHTNINITSINGNLLINFYL